MNILQNLTLNWNDIISETLGAFISGFILLWITLYVQNKNFKKQIEINEIKQFQNSHLFKEHIKFMNSEHIFYFFNEEYTNYKKARNIFENNTKYTERLFNSSFFKCNTHNSFNLLNDFNRSYKVAYSYKPVSTENKLFDNNEYLIIDTFKFKQIILTQIHLLNSILREIENAKKIYTSSKIIDFLNLIYYLIAPSNCSSYSYSNYKEEINSISQFNETKLPVFVSNKKNELISFSQNIDSSNSLISSFYEPIVIHYKNFNRSYAQIEAELMQSVMFYDHNLMQKNEFHFKYLKYSLKHEKHNFFQKLALIFNIIFYNVSFYPAVLFQRI